MFLINLVVLLSNFAFLAINTYIKSSINTRFNLEVEKYKDNLRKQRVSEEKLTKVWDSYRKYYAILVENRLKNNNIAPDVKDRRDKLVDLLREYAPFIPIDIFNALESIIIEKKENGVEIKENIISSDQHKKIVSLFREFLT